MSSQYLVLIELFPTRMKRTVSASKRLGMVVVEVRR